MAGRDRSAPLPGLLLLPGPAGRWPARGGCLLGGALAGALTALSLPPFDLWPLGLFGTGLLGLLLAGRPAPGRALAGAGAGLAQLGIGCLWAASFTLVGYLLLVGFEAALVALACLLVPPGRGRLPCLAGVLVLLEWLRDSWPFGGMPLGGIALGQAGGPLLGLARVGGPLLVAGGAALAGAGLTGLAAAGLASASQHAPAPWRRAVPGVLALALVAVLVLVGSLAPAGGPSVGRLRAALVQGGGARGLTSLEDPGSRVLERSLAVTERLARGTPVGLILWPEDVVRLGGPLSGSAAGAALSALARDHRATVVAGITRPGGPGHFRNELVAIGPSGRVLGTYEKTHPVPFGEVVPFRPLVRHLVSLAAVPEDMVVGRGDGLLRTPAGPLAVLVSYEDFFAARGRSGVRAGGELLLVATNTASYATSQVPGQELAASRLQAVAEGRELLQAATVGVSAVIDPEGRVLARTSLGSAALLGATAQLRTGTTWYSATGDGPVLGLALLALGAGWALAGLSEPRRPARRRAPR